MKNLLCPKEIFADGYTYRHIAARASSCDLVPFERVLVWLIRSLDL